MKIIHSPLTRLIAAFAFLLQSCAPTAFALTPGANTITGSGVSQVTQVQPRSVNLILNSINPAITIVPTGAAWATAGSAIIMTASDTYRWDAGFTPVLLTGATNADYISNIGSSSVSAGTPSAYTFSAQLSTNSAFSITSPSTQARIDVVYTGCSVPRTDTLISIPPTAR